MSIIKLVGCDPALRNTGLASATYDLATGELKIGSVTLVKTDSQKGKMVRASSDDLRCANVMRFGIQSFCSLVKPAFLVAEIPSGTQSARGSMSNGICVGVLAGSPAPLIEVAPLETKLATGDKYASKESIIEWATTQWPNVGWLTKKVKGEVSYIAANEHMADACAIIAAGVRTPAFKNAVAMMGAATFALAA